METRILTYFSRPINTWMKGIEFESDSIEDYDALEANNPENYDQDLAVALSRSLAENIHSKVLSPKDVQKLIDQYLRDFIKNQRIDRNNSVE